MKKLLIILAAGILILTSAVAQSVTYSNSIVFQSLNLATNTGSGVALGTARLPNKTYQVQIQHGTLLSLTNLNTVLQYSTDNSNWTPFQTNSAPSMTNNGAIDAYTITQTTFTIYVRAVQFNTNTAAQSAGAVIVTIPTL